MARFVLFILPAVATLHIGLVPKMVEMLQTPEAYPGTIDQNSSVTSMR